MTHHERFKSMIKMVSLRPKMFVTNNGHALGYVDGIMFAGGYCYGPSPFSEYFRSSTSIGSAVNRAFLAADLDENWFEGLCAAALATIEKYENSIVVDSLTGLTNK